MNLKIKLLIILVFGFFAGVRAQDSDAEQLLEKGVDLSNEGSYNIAIKKFEEALSLDNNLNKAKYELAYAYLQTGNADKAIVYAKEVMKSDDKMKLEAYLILGAAYDQRNKPDKSLKVYKKAVKEYPYNNLAWFNLGLSYYNHHDYGNAEECLTKAITLNKFYAGSHYLLAHIMIKEGESVKAMLALYYFLLLEQDTGRTQDAYEVLEQLWKSDIINTNGNIVVSINRGKNDYYKMLDLSMKLNTVSYKGNYEPADRLKVFSENTKKFFDLLEEENNDKIGFWELTYLDFFKELNKKDYTIPFSYYISNSNYRPQVLVWLSDHFSEFNDFINWMELQQAK